MYKFAGNALPEGLRASNYPVFDTVNNPNAHNNHSFVPENVSVKDGWLNLKVPGGQTSNSISCAEVTTTASNILFASVRVKAKLSGEPGVVNGKKATSAQLKPCLNLNRIVLLSQ